MKRLKLLSLIPPFFLDCVVAIGLMVSTDGKPPEFKAVATGFFYGNKVADTEGAYNMFLVTNRHVIAGVDPKVENIFLRFNPEMETSFVKDYPLNMKRADGSSQWYVHPCSDVDVAVTPINAPVLRKEGMRFNFFQSDKHIVDRAKAIDLGTSEGDGIFVLGFPMGIVGKERNVVVVRQGIIARIRDFLSGSSKQFLADAFVFPGNSGGPVVLRPEVVAIDGTKSNQTSYLIGMVNAFMPYYDTAISTQTKRPRISFEENSGLATVVPMDFVKEAIQETFKPVKERRTTC